MSRTLRHRRRLIALASIFALLFSQIVMAMHVCASCPGEAAAWVSAASPGCDHPAAPAEPSRLLCKLHCAQGHELQPPDKLPGVQPLALASEPVVALLAVAAVAPDRAFKQYALPSMTRKRHLEFCALLI